MPITCVFSALVTVFFVDFLFLERHHRSSRHHKYDKYNDRHCVDRKYPVTEETGVKDYLITYLGWALHKHTLTTDIMLLKCFVCMYVCMYVCFVSVLLTQYCQDC